MLNHQARIIAVMVLSTFAPACSSALSGERMAPNQTSPPTAAPAETPRVTPAADRQPERQAAAAQDARLPFPVAPLIVHYEYVPHYFVQWLNDHPQYTRIEAAVTDSEPPVFNLTLTEKGSGRRVNYCNSEARLKAMAQSGQEARLTKIDYRAMNNFGQAPAHEFSFTDERGQAVRWRFTLAAPDELREKYGYSETITQLQLDKQGKIKEKESETYVRSAAQTRHRRRKTA